jgi:hypothetical protein
VSAGLPGVGLSGIFFILSALVAVPLELRRTLQRRSSLARWAAVLRHFAFAIVMIGSLELFYAIVHLSLARLPHLVAHLTHGLLTSGSAASGLHVQTIPVLPLLATLGLVACVIALAKGAELVSRVSQRAALSEIRSAARRMPSWPSSHSTTSPRASALAYPEPTSAPLADRVAGGVGVRRIARAAAPKGLVVLMAAGSVAIWTLIPLGGLWLASQLSDSFTELSPAPLLVATAAIPAAMILATKALALLERLHLRATEAEVRARRLPARRPGMTGNDSPPETGVLETIMVANAVLAVAGLAIWFFLVSGFSLPA